MTPERFETLAEAYGGDIARWPAAERDAAALRAAAHPDEAYAALARAGSLDALLDAAPAPRAPAGLIQRIAAGAPLRRERRWSAWWLPAGMGAGLAAACAAGVVVGMQLAEPALSEADAVVAAVTEGLGLDADEDA